jgi:hypothetical protein
MPRITPSMRPFEIVVAVLAALTLGAFIVTMIGLH